MNEKEEFKSLSLALSQYTNLSSLQLHIQSQKIENKGAGSLSS